MDGDRMSIYYIFGILLIIAGILVVAICNPHLNGGIIAIIGGLFLLAIGYMEFKIDDKKIKK